MNRISEELRRLIDGENLNPIQTARLRRIADRIDTETVELPRDRYGVVIHVGDTVYRKDGDGPEVVTSIILKNLASHWKVWIRALMACAPTPCNPVALTHTRPDSWERIADELDAWCDGTDVDGDACEKPRALAGRIRTLAEREEGE